MPYSYAVYTGNGATTQFTVSFPYIRREHVFVSIDYVSAVFTWVNSSTIAVSPAPTNGARVEIRRVTPVNAPLVDFADGSTLIAADLDANALQQTYINQEQDDQFQDAIFINAQGLLDANGKRITDVGNPVDAQDATTKTYVDNFVSQTANIANGAVTTAKLADADLQTLAGAQAGAATAFAALTAGEVATLDGITSSTSELNQLSGKTITGSLNPANANDIPTSTAVNTWVSGLINALGGFVAIPNRNSFPASNPDPSDDAGTVVSIADAGGLVVNGSGTATNAQTTGAAAVTITGFPSVYQGTTLPAGLGVQVQTTTTLNTYTFHKSIPTDADIAQLNDDVNDFFARYRIGTANPTTDLDAGDLFFNTTIGKMLVYDGLSSSWEEVQSFGNFSINTLSSSGGTGGGSATFNGTAYRFTLSNPPTVAQQLLVSINGVVQKPNAGTAQPAEGFAIDGNDIIFSQAPATSSPFFIVTIGTTVTIGAPSDGTVTTAKLVDGSVTTAKIANDAVTTAKIANDAVTTAKIANDAVTTAKIADANVTTSKVADANITTAKIADTNITTAKIADTNVTTAKLADQAVTAAKVSGSGSTSGQVLTSTGASTAPNWVSVDPVFPAGTALLFQQTTAPTGWTKSTTHNDKALRVVSGTASSGGATAFSAVMNGSVDATTLTEAQMPSHSHTQRTYTAGSGGNTGGAFNIVPTNSPLTTVSTGGGGSHTHTMNVAYVDVIIATKD